MSVKLRLAKLEKTKNYYSRAAWDGGALEKANCVFALYDKYDGVPPEEATGYVKTVFEKLFAYIEAYKADPEITPAEAVETVAQALIRVGVA